MINAIPEYTSQIISCSVAQATMQKKVCHSTFCITKECESIVISTNRCMNVDVLYLEFYAGLEVTDPVSQQQHGKAQH